MNNEQNQKYLKEVGERLKGVRKRLNITQKEAAEATGMTQSYLSAIERGQKSACTAQIIKLISFYRVPYSMVFGTQTNDYSMSEFPKSGISMTSFDLLMRLMDRTHSEALIEGTKNCVRLRIYIMFRTIYRENPRNSEKIFSVDYDEACERINDILRNAYDDLSQFIRYSRSVSPEKLELPVEMNPELREFISECEKMIKMPPQDLSQYL